MLTGIENEDAYPISSDKTFKEIIDEIFDSEYLSSFYYIKDEDIEDTIKKKDDLQEKYMKIAGSTDKFISENALRRKLEDMRLPYLESVFGYNGGYNAALDDISSYLNGEES